MGTMASEQLSIDESLKIIVILFRYGGLSLKSNERRTNMETLKVRLVYLFNFSCLNTDLCGETYWFVKSLAKRESFLQLTFIAPCLAISMMSNLKSFLIIHNEKVIEEVIDSLRSLEITEMKSKRVEEKVKIMARDKKFLNRIIVSLISLNLLLVSTFFINPCVIMVVKYLKTNEVDLILPFTTIYPFDPYDVKYFPFVFLHQNWSVCVVNLTTCCADYLLYTCCSYIRTQFRLLKYDLMNIIPDLGNNVITDAGDEEFKKKFKDIIKRHQLCIRVASLLEVIYSKSILYNFMTSSLLICLTGFNVMAIKDIGFIVTCLLFLLMNLMQVFFLCFFGDMLMRSSTDISKAVYNSRWYSADPAIGKSLLILLTRTQKPCKLTAMGFADVNLMAFTSVLSTSWSYFCLLNTIYRPSIDKTN